MPSSLDQFTTGDLIFVRPAFDPSRPVDNAILDVGAATIQWLRDHAVRVSGNNETTVHVAIAWRNESDNGALSFIEAAPPAVRLTPATLFWSGWPSATFYHGKLRETSLRQAGRRAAQIAIAKLGTPYSDAFAPPPDEFYCSSLVEWAYQQAMHRPHVFVDQPFPLIFVPRPFWERYYMSLNLTLPPANTTGSNPTLLLHSAHVTYTALPPPPLLSAVGDDPLALTIELAGRPLWAPGSLAFLCRGTWHSAAELHPTGAAAKSSGGDALGSFIRRARTYSLCASPFVVELSVRSYDSGRTLVYEQAFPNGYNSTTAAAAATTTRTSHHAPPKRSVGLAPLVSWPSFALSGASDASAWRSWHGTYGSFGGVGLSHKDTLVFNGVPTMPLLFFGKAPAKDGAPSLMVSPLDAFKAHAHAALEVVPTANSSSSSSAASSSTWHHGPSHRFGTLPPGFSLSTILVAARGQTATLSSWGEAMRTWHRTDRRPSLAADLTTSRLGYWTDNGAYYNFNKWAGNLRPGHQWSPRRQPSQSPDALLSRTLHTLREAGVRPGYLQLDDWYYEGLVYEGAVSCVRNWQGRRDWFPKGLEDFSHRNAIPLLLYLPYLCNDTALRSRFDLDVEAASQAKRGGVVDAPYPSSKGCAWPQNTSCVGVYALPSPPQSEGFYGALFDLGISQGISAPGPYVHSVAARDGAECPFPSLPLPSPPSSRPLPPLPPLLPCVRYRDGRL